MIGREMTGIKSKLSKTQKIVIDENGKVRIVEDFQKQLKQKPAGQQRWNTTKQKVKRK